MQPAKNLRILVLDSCRDNPLAEQLKRLFAGSLMACSVAALQAAPLPTNVTAMKSMVAASQRNRRPSSFQCNIGDGTYLGGSS
jgi:hypothetical protein